MGPDWKPRRPVVSQGGSFITRIKVSHMTYHSGKPKKLWNVQSIKGTTRNVIVQKGKVYYHNIKVIALVI